MRKKLIIVLCLTAVLLMSACGQTEEVTAETAAPEATEAPAEATEAPAEEAVVDTQGTEITFWYCYTDKVQENNINLTNEFNETLGKELGITVTAEYQGDYATMAQKLKAAYVAGTNPEVTVMDTTMLKPFVQGNVLAPFDSYIERDAVDMGDFQPSFLTDSTVDGQVYSLPYLRSTTILYLNTTLLEEAGLDPKGPADWDEFAEYAATVKEKTGKYGFTGFMYPWFFESWMQSYGSSLYNEDVTATNVNSDAAKSVINNIIAMRDNGSANIIASSEGKNLIGEVTNQNCAMWFYSTGAITTFEAIAAGNGFGVSTAFMPKGTVQTCGGGGANLVMLGNLDEAKQEAAWQFINWMTQKEQTITASMATGYLPTRISALDDPAITALCEKMPSYKVAMDQLQYAGDTSASAAEADALITQAVDSIWVNNQDVDATLSDVEAKVNALLNE